MADLADRRAQGGLGKRGYQVRQPGPPAPPRRPLPGPRSHPGQKAGTEQAAPPAPRRLATPGPRRRASRRHPYPPVVGTGPRAAPENDLTFPLAFCELLGALSAILPLPSLSPGGEEAIVDPTEPVSGGREADGRDTDGAASARRGGAWPCALSSAARGRWVGGWVSLRVLVF